MCIWDLVTMCLPRLIVYSQRSRLMRQAAEVTSASGHRTSAHANIMDCTCGHTWGSSDQVINNYSFSDTTFFNKQDHVAIGIAGGITQ